jgi:hypothetical protein
MAADYLQIYEAQAELGTSTQQLARGTLAAIPEGIAS